jgi:hypothetical protein
VPALQQPFPQDYNQAVRQAQAAVQAALADGATLLEVEFPTASLASVAGDAEGVWVWWGVCCICCHSSHVIGKGSSPEWRMFRLQMSGAASIHTPTHHSQTLPALHFLQAPTK